MKGEAMKRKILIGCVLAGAVILTLLVPVDARIKLVTKPGRDSVSIRLDNKRYTLVEEERTVPLQTGTNRLDFSWANIRIDKESILIRVVEKPKGANEVNVLSQSYPPGENALVWDVSTDAPGPCRIRISYLLFNLNRVVSYRAIAEKDEKQMVFKTYLKLRNFSGEDFEQAAIHVGYGENFKKSMKNGESKQMLSAKHASVPIVKTYTYDYSKYGGKTPMHYKIVNDDKNQLGKYALQVGKARIFIIKDPKSRDTAFLGEDWLRGETGDICPIGGEAKLFLGLAQDIKVNADELTPVRAPQRMFYEEVNKRGNAYNLRERYKLEIKNFKKEDITLDCVVHIDGYWEMEESTHKYEKKDYRTLIFHVKVPKGGKPVEVVYQYLRKNLWR
jgi:hypothetical protein